MDLSKILAALEKGVEFAEQFTPIIASLTPYGALAATAIKAVGAVTDTVTNLQARIDEGQIVAGSTDQEQVRALAQRLHDINDELARQVDAS